MRSEPEEIVWSEDRPVIKASLDVPHRKVEFYAVYDVMFLSELGMCCDVKRLLQKGEGYTVRNHNKEGILHIEKHVRRIAAFHQ